MHTHSLAEYMRHVSRGDWQGVAELMLSSARKLAGAGASFLICPDNTIHQAMADVIPRSPRPWLHIAEVVADDAVARAFRRLALTGTRSLVDSDVYPQTLAARGIDCVKPDSAERDVIDRIIFDELAAGRVVRDSQRKLKTLITELAKQKVQAVVLGCTELVMAVDVRANVLPVYDTTAIHARACIDWMLAEEEPARAAA